MCCPSCSCSLTMVFTLRGTRARFVARQGEARSRLTTTRRYLVRERERRLSESPPKGRDARRSDARAAWSFRAMLGRPETANVAPNALMGESCHEQAEDRDHSFNDARGPARRQGGRLAPRHCGGAQRLGVRARRPARLSAAVLRRAEVAVVGAGEERSRAALDEEGREFRRV